MAPVLCLRTAPVSPIRRPGGRRSSSDAYCGSPFILNLPASPRRSLSKDGTCRDVCPVGCIYEGGRMMYIQPDECIDCGLCLSVCPVDAIHSDADLPLEHNAFARVNAEYF